MLAIYCFILFLLGCGVSIDDLECQRRDYGDGKIVCVCNSDYCDTLSRPEKIEQPQYYIYTSNKAGLRFKKEIGEFQPRDNNINDNPIVVNSHEKFQEILGWGGTFTDTSGINIKSLNDKTQENLLRSYFSDEGIEYSLCRVPMGATDFSLRGYSYDDGDVDPELLNFKLAEEDYLYKIPYIKKALNLTNNNLQLICSAWTAPKWMKSNGKYNGFGFLLPKMYQVWANYFVKFLDSYKSAGIEFWGITTGNEPILSYLPFFNKINSVGWTPSSVANWILNNLGPTLRNSNYSDIKIMVMDDQKFFLPWLVQIILKENATRKYIDGIAIHWYFDVFFSPNLLTKTHDYFPEKFLLATEASNGYIPFGKHVDLGSWERGELYAEDIIEDISNWVSGWIDWNMVLDLTGGPTYVEYFADSPIIVNTTAGEFYKQPMFYNLGHFSKFIPRGSLKIFSSSFDKNILTVAFQRPDNGIVLVILNKKEEAISATIVDELRGVSEIKISEKSITTVLYW